MLHLKIVATMILLFTSAALAGAPPFGAGHHPKPAATAAIANDSFSFTGKVVKVDYAANAVELDTDSRRVTVIVEPTTVIDIAGEPGSVSDIRPGIKIHAEGVVRNGAFIAETITIHGGAKHRVHDSSVRSE
jgi:hypothetical protein